MDAFNKVSILFLILYNVTTWYDDIYILIFIMLIVMVIRMVICKRGFYLDLTSSYPKLCFGDDYVAMRPLWMDL